MLGNASTSHHYLIPVPLYYCSSSVVSVDSVAKNMFKIILLTQDRQLKRRATKNCAVPVFNLPLTAVFNGLFQGRQQGGDIGGSVGGT